MKSRIEMSENFSLNGGNIAKYINETSKFNIDCDCDYSIGDYGDATHIFGDFQDGNGNGIADFFDGNGNGTVDASFFEGNGNGFHDEDSNGMNIDQAYINAMVEDYMSDHDVSEAQAEEYVDINYDFEG